MTTATEISSTAITTRIVLATENQGKLAELRALVGPGIEVIGLGELDLTLPEETGSTFAENAIVKAQTVTDATGLVALADDSGLEVDALDGAPGIYSARYAGEAHDDAANRAKLLAELAEVPAEQRSARFVSVIALVSPGEEPVTVRGTVEGTITFAERGTGGFGYDSLFELANGKTLAELSSEEKNAISHRGHAMRQIAPVVAERLSSSVPPASSEG